MDENHEDVTLEPTDSQNTPKSCTYKASCTYIPVDKWKNPKNNVATKAFEIETRKFQEMSRESLAKWRKRERQVNADKNREEDMSNYDLFAKLTENFDCLERKIRDQETKMIQNNATINS